MPISVPCADCGKVYSVSSKLAGKRAKCQACGNVFKIARPPSAPQHKPVVAPAPKVYCSDEVIIAAFTTPASHAISPAARRVEREMQILSWLQLRWWILFIALVYACVVGIGAAHWPGVFKLSRGVYPIAASVLLILGLIYTVARELWVRGDEKILWDDLRLVMSQFVMVVFLRLRRFAFRRSVLRPDQYRNVFRRMTIVLLQAALLAGMIAVFPAAKAAAKSLPKLDQVQKSMDSFFNDPHKHKHPSAPADGV